MIKSADAIRLALKRNIFTGIILYIGPSMLDGSPIVAIANRIVAKSANAKTGALVQTFIIRADVNPLEALASGADVSICGGCKHRPTYVLDKAKKRSFIGPCRKLARSCYVNVGRSVMSVYGAFTRGRYAMPGVDFDPAILPQLFAGSSFRIGSYGDGAAVPFQVWRRATLMAAAVLGYSHQWRDPRFQAFKLLCMASADTVEEQASAVAMGWRVFRVAALNSIKLVGEVRCPASKEMGRKLTCAECKACGGTSSKARASIVIEAHHVGAKSYA